MTARARRPDRAGGRRRRGRLRALGGAGDPRGLRRLRLRALGDRRARPRRRHRAYPRSRTITRPHPAPHHRAGAGLDPSGHAGRAIAARMLAGAGLCRRARRSSCSSPTTAACWSTRWRPGAQFRPLDPGRLRGRPVRAAHPRRRRLAAGRSTERHSDAVMQNLIGDDAERWRSSWPSPATKLHLYGKRESAPRPQDGPCKMLFSGMIPSYSEN
jgi:hypothetical protein